MEPPQARVGGMKRPLEELSLSFLQKDLQSIEDELIF
jgi:hypothetical protein